MPLPEHAAEQGVRTPNVTVGGHLMMGDDEDAHEADDALVRSLVDVHGMTPEAVAGTSMTARTPAELAEIFVAYHEAGADRIVTGADNWGWTAQLKFIAEARAVLADTRRSHAPPFTHAHRTIQVTGGPASLGRIGGYDEVSPIACSMSDTGRRWSALARSGRRLTTQAHSEGVRRSAR
jgi:hypothetical protein